MFGMYAVRNAHLTKIKKPWDSEVTLTNSFSSDANPITTISFKFTSKEQNPAFSCIRFVYASTSAKPSLFVTLGPGFSIRTLEHLPQKDKIWLTDAFTSQSSQEFCLTADSLCQELGKFDRLGLGPGWVNLAAVVAKAIEMHPSVAGLLREEFMDKRAVFEEARALIYMSSAPKC